jgi:hypothetical protein
MANITDGHPGFGNLPIAYTPRDKVYVQPVKVTNSAIAQLLQVNPTGAATPRTAATPTATKPNWTMADIERIEGGRNNFILVMVDNPKKADTKVRRLWPLYGEKGKPTVTVRGYMAELKANDNNPKHPAYECGGQTKARAALRFDLNHGFIKIVEGGAGN